MVCVLDFHVPHPRLKVDVVEFSHKRATSGLQQSETFMSAVMTLVAYGRCKQIFVVSKPKVRNVYFRAQI